MRRSAIAVKFFAPKFCFPVHLLQKCGMRFALHRAEEGLMLVGHNPLFDSLGPYLLGTPSLQDGFQKGSDATCRYRIVRRSAARGFCAGISLRNYQRAAISPIS